MLQNKNSIGFCHHVMANVWQLSLGFQIPIFALVEHFTSHIGLYVKRQYNALIFFWWSEHHAYKGYFWGAPFFILSQQSGLQCWPSLCVSFCSSVEKILQFILVEKYFYQYELIFTWSKFYFIFSTIWIILFPW